MASCVEDGLRALKEFDSVQRMRLTLEKGKEHALSKLPRCLPPHQNGKPLYCLEVCLQKQCHESSVRQAIVADNAIDLSAALERPRCLGALFPDVNLAAEGALHLAVESASPELVQTLLSKGAEVNASDEHQNTALHTAARRGNPEVLAVLLKVNAIDINQVGGTPLAAARPFRLSAPPPHADPVAQPPARLERHVRPLLS